MMDRMNTSDTDFLYESQERRPWLSQLRETLRLHQRVVSGFQYLAGSLVLLIPASIRHYEVWTEGIYSMSRLLCFLNEKILDTSFDKVSGIEPLLVLISQGIPQVEVLIEKASESFGNIEHRNSAILGIESIKSLSRLAILIKRGQVTMLLNWGRGFTDGAVYDIAHYIQWYRTLAQQARLHRSASRGYDGNSNLPSMGEDGNLAEHTSYRMNGGCGVSLGYIGRRTGLKIPDLSGFRVFHTHGECSEREQAQEQEQQREEPEEEEEIPPEVAGQRQRSHEVGRKLSKPTAHEIASEMERWRVGVDLETAGCLNRGGLRDPMAGCGSNGGVNVFSSQSMNDERMHREIEVGTVPEAAQSSHAVSSQRNEYCLSPEQMLALGEVLYVLRPAVHAWVIHKLTSSSSTLDPRASMDSGQGSRPSVTFSGGRRAAQVSTSHAVALLVAFATETLSVCLTHTALKTLRNHSTDQLSEEVLEGRLHAYDTELKRRKFALLFNLLRSPMFDVGTLPLIKRMTNAVGEIPLVSTVLDYLVNVLTYVNATHFYSSASS